MNLDAFLNTGANNPQRSSTLLEELTEVPNNEDTTLLLVRNPSTTNEKVTRVIFLLFTAGIFSTSLYFATQEVKNVEETRRKYTISMWGTGASFALFCHILFPHKLRKIAYKVMNAGAYEAWFALSNGYLNVPSPQLRKILHGGFAAMTGYFQSRDVAILFSMRRSDFAQILDFPANEEDIIPMVFSNTRNRANAKILNTLEAVAAVALTILFFVFRDRDFDDLHRHGLYGNIAAGFTGTVIGKLIARVTDDLKEHFETKHRLGSIEDRELPFSLKAVRLLKTGFLLAAPLSFTALLQLLKHPTRNIINGNPNSGTDYITMVFIGAIYGALYFLTKRERENPLSSYHKIINHKNISVNTPGSKESCCKRVWMETKDYIFTFFCLVALNAYMITAGVRSGETRIIVAITALLASSFFSCLFTGYIVKNHVPKTNKDLKLCSTFDRLKARFVNEVYFRATTPALSAFLYQFLRAKFDINDQDMQGQSIELLAAAVATWMFWGFPIGNSRALFMLNQQREPYTPALASTEMMLVLGNGLKV